jgi:hypothetical protein
MGDDYSSIDMPFGLDYQGSPAIPTVPTQTSIWDSAPLNDVWGMLIGAGVTRAAYEINKPAIAASNRPNGLFGKIGTVGISSDTQKLVVLILIIASAVYLVPHLLKKG